MAHPAQGGVARLWRQLASKPLGLLGVIVVALALVAAVAAPVAAPYDPVQTDFNAVLKSPSTTHWLGTDDLGRDVLSRVLAGAAASLQASLLAVGLAVLIGVPLGLVSGYLGGWFDQVAMRAVDALLAFPALVLALGITAALGPSLLNAGIAIGVATMPRFARLVRGMTLSLRTREFVDAARAIGARAPRILFRHILPNAAAPITVQASLSIGFAIIAEASLSFLGLGVQPPTPSWGSMLKVGYAYMDLAPWIAIAPGVAIVLTVLGFMLLADAVNQVLDPGRKRR
ncbi:MAG TPA: hypothetical protein DEP84_30515 [Chloroflexi bacterium]|nr:hypothetical protein [Chloroflexota bacterium]